MSTSDTPRTYHHGNLPAVLRQAAWDIVGEAGVRSVSLRECARRANVSHAAPAHHFGSLENLLAEVVADGYERMVDSVQAAQRELDDPVLGCGMGYVNFARQYPQHFRLMFGMTGVNRALPRLVNSGEATLQLLRQSLRTAWIAKNGVEPEPALLEQRTLLAWSTAHGYASLAIDRTTVEPFVVSAESILQPMAVFLLTP
ncbi:TetR family transcriptional regulator [Pseudomonas syringae pv. tomato]|uniref:TetR/AcrR family transcriptional regulator n=3 Tax=Pseudomonas syringae group TaxID=136849 RepID=A0AAW4E1M6_PSESX|nr:MULTISPECIES: TetR/AcrR family transcriptional regulator [Pseudomonas syringae group]AVI85841.1 TetR family transcriptional regulator [Pseudomonas syringae pv. tomato]EEB60088.1 transcriptional regulator, TetR family [Pseudomonas syringae pv. tomato T1]KGK95952.1 TetR family transcriptional regulator [Pseudomonas syringae pv. tomato]KPB84844.1 Transcriptional regulator [Pseudomonas syringae pv. maculicola]KUR47466.1 HTH-type transcriptional regulator BetI [Pseudomonas syringae pv. tomato]